MVGVGAGGGERVPDVRRGARRAAGGRAVVGGRGGAPGDGFQSQSLGAGAVIVAGGDPPDESAFGRDVAPAPVELVVDEAHRLEHPSQAFFPLQGRRIARRGLSLPPLRRAVQAVLGPQEAELDLQPPEEVGSRNLRMLSPGGWPGWRSTAHPGFTRECAPAVFSFQEEYQSPPAPFSPGWYSPSSARPRQRPPVRRPFRAPARGRRSGRRGARCRRRGGPAPG